MAGQGILSEPEVEIPFEALAPYDYQKSRNVVNQFP
jgi:hypothetical protein